MTTLSLDMTPLGVLKSIPGWEGLDKKDQIAIERETKLLQENKINFVRSGLAIGEHLANIQARLEPKRMFTKYLDANRWKRSTAYNHIIAFKNAKAWLPEPILRAVIERNMSMIGITEDKPLGIYTSAVKKLPPPPTSDPKKIHNYLDQLEEVRVRADRRSSSKIESVEEDPNVLLKETYRFAVIRLKKIKGRNRRNFVDALAGMLLSEIGVSSGVTFEPQAVPEDFVAQVGRPSTAAA